MHVIPEFSYNQKPCNVLQVSLLPSGRSRASSDGHKGRCLLFVWFTLLVGPEPEIVSYNRRYEPLYHLKVKLIAILRSFLTNNSLNKSKSEIRLSHKEDVRRESYHITKVEQAFHF